MEEVERFCARHKTPGRDAEPANGMREQVLDAALEIAAAEGVRGASMRRIAGRVGMRTATLYSYFPDGKDQLISAALSSLLKAFYRNAAQGLRPGDSSLENLRSLVFLHVRWVLEKPKTVPAWDVVVAADRISPVLTDSVRDELEELKAGYRQLIRRLLEDLGIEHTAAVHWAEMIIVICDEILKWGQPGSTLAGPFEAEEFMWLAVRRILCLPSAVDEGLTRSPSVNDIR